MYPSWKDRADHASAFYIAIVRERGLRSVRDLDGAKHLGLLEELRDKSYAAMERTHGLSRPDIKAFFHYQPSFFHLHVHFRWVGPTALRCCVV